jgi:hypothetical protein
MNNYTHSQHIPRGYIAVVSALILSGSITAILFVESTSVFWARDDESDQEAYTQSEALAASCVYSALLNFQKNPAPVASSTEVAVDPSSSDSRCEIDSILPGSNAITITTHALFHNAYSGYVVTASSSLSSGIMSITSWRDITSIPP